MNDRNILIMAITNWPLDERLREKLLAKGPQSLSGAELVAIFLRTGIKGRGVVELARTQLVRFGSLSALAGAATEIFCSEPGLGLTENMLNCRRRWILHDAPCVKSWI